jgi:hypothetical protein
VPNYSRGTIRKTLQTLAMVLDHAGIDPNPARDKSVKLPRADEEEINPPSADHIEAVCRRIAEKHLRALLWLDWSGARVSSIDLTLVGDYDEPRRRVRLRKGTTKTRRPLWVELPPVLAEAIEATLPHRRFRDHEARLFAESGADALRTAIAKACKAEASRCGHLTIFATGGSRYSICGARRGRESASSSGRRACPSRRTRIRTSLQTSATLTMPGCSPWAENARNVPVRVRAVLSRCCPGSENPAICRQVRFLPGPFTHSEPYGFGLVTRRAGRRDRKSRSRAYLGAYLGISPVR